MIYLERNWNAIMSTFGGKTDKKIPTYEMFLFDYKLKFEDENSIYYVKTLTTLDGVEGIVYVFCGIVINKNMLAYSESGYLEFKQLANAKQVDLSKEELKMDIAGLFKYFKNNK
ncbi:MAG: hypothetical protein ABF289_09605 [Clostridiales bacterium]